MDKIGGYVHLITTVVKNYSFLLICTKKFINISLYLNWYFSVNHHPPRKIIVPLNLILICGNNLEKKLDQNNYLIENSLHIKKILKSVKII